ncbi:hypothetical protein MVEN_02172300 [Mycena venus]|uniref:Uncharacterized protein n=1 Tax=Mycena venus TaxID=2733690 RepID=A0A8H6X954_9AGAR|nr:hypothetical protein MVEN_02172300 [Mycena venus]
MRDATPESITDDDCVLDATPPTMSLPEVEPNPEVVKRFWNRVAEVTARYQNAQKKWTGTQELKAWNRLHVEPCQKCTNSKTNRQCIIDEDHTSCRPCRTAKIGCDRKRLFVFDVTKDDFFPTHDQFSKVYRNRSAGRKRSYRPMGNAVGPSYNKEEPWRQSE